MAFSSTSFHYEPSVEVQNAVQLLNTPSDQSTIDQQVSVLHSSAPSLSLFPNAQNFEVKGGQFNAISGNVTIHNTTENNNMTANNYMGNHDSVSTILWPHVAAGAIFDSAARHTAGKCHPGTRKKIIDRILDWIKNPDPIKRISWIYGAAGAGKTALAHTICELLKELHPDEYGASFFFSGGSTDCGDASKLFATLAYQLSIHFPPIRAEINATLARDPSLPTKSMEIQMLHLIVQPVQRCRTLLSHDPVLIIDGLDECADDSRGTTQANIIALVAKCIYEYNIPLRFMISSRPEYWIRDTFATVPLPRITLPLSLRDDVDADKDIEAYLTEGFEKIRLENKHFMKSVASPWPPKDIVDRFVEEASGQYIYPATVLRFVGNYSKFTNPQKQLAIITSPGPHRAVAFSQLDRLYATIVAVYPEWHSMKRVLAALLLGANTTIIKVVLGVDPEELDAVLDALSSLVEKAKKKPLFNDDLKEEELLESIVGSLREEGAMSFCHRSFQEFLQNKDRSGPFHIDLKSDEVPVDIVKGYFGMIQRNFDQHYETQPHIFLNIELATYHHTFQDTIKKSTMLCRIDTLLPLITRITAELEHYDPGRLTHMHSVFYFADDIGYLSSTVWATRFYKYESGPSTEIQTTYEKLRQAIDLARERALSSLASCTDFNATPTLVYLTDYHKSVPGWNELPITEFGTIAGVVDVISTLRQHHYLVPLWWSSFDEAFKIDTTRRTFFTENPGPGSWRSQGTWRDLLHSFVPRSLKYIFTKRESDTDTNSDDPMHSPRLHYQFEALEKFFNWQSISDICDKGYFRSTYNQTILAPMTDMDAWVGLLSRSNHILLFNRPSFICSVLCWINRQLTNPHTLMLLEEYDKTLEQKLATVSRYIFYDSFLKDFIKDSRNKSLLTFQFRYRGENNSLRSTTMKVRPLPHGFYEEKDEDEWEGGYFDWYPRDWQEFHNGIFGKPAGSIEASVNSIILPTDWHPHLGARLLEVLVRFLYGKFHEESSDRPYYAYEESFPYLIPCLPYIHPTAKNLDALRAIVYLYPKVTPAWDPSEQFWPLLLGFIQKYDRSILSSEELELFTTWLNSTEHAEITTYISDTHDTAPSIVAPENATTSGGTSHSVDSAANITNPHNPFKKRC